MSRDYAHEDWIPWYVRWTASWVELSLAARGAAEGIAREMGRDRDELPLGSRGIRALATVLRRPWEEVEPAIKELLAPGPEGEPPRLEYDAARKVLRDPQAGARRRPTSTKRVQAMRDREKAKSDQVAPVETRETVTPVSKRGGTSVAVPSPSDLISSGSSSGRDPEPDRSPTPRLWGRGPTAERALEVFADAITAVTGEPFVVGRAPFLRDDLCEVMNKLAPKGATLDAGLVWLGDTVQAWVRADPECHDRKPSKLTDWLNAGKPDRAAKAKRGAEVTKQPFDPNAPWMKLGDTGS